jgi:hypothetical protein
MEKQGGGEILKTTKTNPKLHDSYQGFQIPRSYYIWAVRQIKVKRETLDLETLMLLPHVPCILNSNPNV